MIPLNLLFWLILPYLLPLRPSLLLIDLKLPHKNLLVYLDAPLWDIDKNEQVVKDVTESQEILSVRLAKLLIVHILKVGLNALVFYHELRENFLLGKLKKDLDKVWTGEVIKAIQHLEGQGSVDLPQ